MDYNLIVDKNTIGWPNGFGCVYQGATPDGEITTLDPAGKLMLVEMAAGIDALHWVRQGDLTSVLYFGIDDSPTDTLSDTVMLGLAGACKNWLRQGNDVLFGCGAGISRSSYGDCATLMAVLNESFDTALAVIRRSRSVANPNPGFVAHLQHLETQLRAVP